MATNINLEGTPISKLPRESNPAGVDVSGVKSGQTVKVSLDTLVKKTELDTLATKTELDTLATKTELDNLENRTQTKIENIENNRKGYFSTDTQLKAAHPTPQVGWYAYVGLTGTIWKESGGNWVDSGDPIPDDVDFSNVATKDEIAQLAGEVTELYSQSDLASGYYSPVLGNVLPQNPSTSSNKWYVFVDVKEGEKLTIYGRSIESSPRTYAVLDSNRIVIEVAPIYAIYDVNNPINITIPAGGVLLLVQVMNPSVFRVLTEKSSLFLNKRINNLEGDKKNLQEIINQRTKNTNYCQDITRLMFAGTPSRAISTASGIRVISDNYADLTAVPQNYGKLSIVLFGTVIGVVGSSDRIRVLIQYTGYSGSHYIDGNGEKSVVLREVDYNPNMGNIRIRIYAEGNAIADVSNVYVGGAYGSYTQSIFNEGAVSLANNLTIIGENKNLEIKEPAVLSTTDYFDVKNYSTLYLRIKAESVNDQDTVRVLIRNASNNINVSDNYFKISSEGVVKTGFITIPVSGIDRMSILISSTALIHEVLLSDTKLELNTLWIYSSIDAAHGKINAADLVNNLPINVLPNSGDARNITFISNTDYVGIGDGYKLEGNNVFSIYRVASSGHDRYAAIINPTNIIGTPQIGFRHPNGSNITYYKITEGATSYRMPAGHYDIFINPGAGGSIEISQFYFGDNPYNAEWVIPIEIRTIDNYFLNQDLNGIANVQEDAYGRRFIRVYGNNAERGIGITFDKIENGNYFSTLYTSSVESIRIRIAHVATDGVSHNTRIENTKAYPNVEHITQYQFSDDHPRGSIGIYFTGTEEDYLDVFLPAVTRESRKVDDILRNAVRQSARGDGVKTYDTIRDVLLDNPDVAVVGELMVIKTNNIAGVKSDYNAINAVKPSVNSKLTNIKYVDLLGWKLKAITSDLKFILVKNSDVRFTYDIDSCLNKAEYETEDRYTLDETKLTQMFTAPVRMVRELSNKELVFLTSGTSHYFTTNNQTDINQSSAHPAAIGSRIDGWGVDAHDDTVVFSTYSPAGDTGYGLGSVILSIDGGKTYKEVLNVNSSLAVSLLGETARAKTHVHGVFIDPFRDAIIVLLGDYAFDEYATGKILVLDNYKKNQTNWRLLRRDFEGGMPREQYCTGIALDKCNLYGTDMQETCIARQVIGKKGLETPREWADKLHNGLDYIPSFTRPVEPGAPVGIHYSHVGASNPNTPSSSIVLTKDGYYFPVIYTDTIQHAAFVNNDARVWCTRDGRVYCTQFNRRFENELIIGHYNGYNMI